MESVIKLMMHDVEHALIAMMRHVVMPLWLWHFLYQKSSCRHHPCSAPATPLVAKSKQMVASFPLLALAYPLAAAPGNKGRQRYAPKRRKGAVRQRPSDGRGAAPTGASDSLPPPPRPTQLGGSFPTYYTCRHCYEDTLMEELMLQDSTLTVSSPYGASSSWYNMDDDDSKSDALRDPVYALQVLPNCRIVEISNSIKGLAKIISEIPEFEFMLQQAPKGSLVIHALACTGHVQQGTTRSQTSKTSTSSRRCYIGIVEKEISSCTQGFQQGAIVVLLLLQIMQFSPDVAAVVSLSKCQRGMMLWPNPNLPVGLANVDVDMKMLSSALSETSRGLCLLAVHANFW